MQQAGKVDGLLLVGSVLGVHLNQFGVSDNLLQTLHADFTQVFAHLLGQEGKEVNHVLGSTLKVLTQLGVLGSHTHGAGIGVTLTHHHTAQNNQGQCSERELVGTKHSHDNHVLGSLQLSVGLQANLVTQAVHHQCLLGLGQSDLRTNTCKSHT